MNCIKKSYSKVRDMIYLMKKYGRNYSEFFIRDYGVIKKELKSKGVNKLRISNFGGWKIWYNCCYFTGCYIVGGVNKKVFVKVMGPLLDDCHENEKLINDYICRNSEYLADRCPHIYLTTKTDQYSMIVAEYTELNPIVKNKALVNDTTCVINEYTRIGIIHTDFGLVNMGEWSGMNYFFDYGTSLCKESNRIRVRNGEKYNHISDITDIARKLMPDADFYYDDVIHMKIDLPDIDREKICFIVGKEQTYYARFADEIVQYRLIRKWNDDTIYLLEKK